MPTTIRVAGDTITEAQERAIWLAVAPSLLSVSHVDMALREHAPQVVHARGILSADEHVRRVASAMLRYWQRTGCIYFDHLCGWTTRGRKAARS